MADVVSKTIKTQIRKKLSDGTYQVEHPETSFENIINVPMASRTKDGLMSKKDKAKLDDFLLQEAYMDLFNGGQNVPWKAIGEYKGIKNDINRFCAYQRPSPDKRVAFGVQTVNKINLSEWKYLHVNCYTPYTNNYWSHLVITSVDNSASYSQDFVLKQSLGTSSNEFSIFVGDIQGQYYIKFITELERKDASVDQEIEVKTRTYLSNSNI